MMEASQERGLQRPTSQVVEDDKNGELMTLWSAFDSFMSFPESICQGLIRFFRIKHRVPEGYEVGAAGFCVGYWT